MRLKKKNSTMAKVEVYEMLRFCVPSAADAIERGLAGQCSLTMGNEAAEIPANDAMPCGP